MIPVEIADLHARYWDSPRFEDSNDLGWLAPRGTGNIDGDSAFVFVKMALANLGAQFDAPFHRIADLYLAQVPAIVELWNCGPHTLVHGDPHLGLEVAAAPHRPGRHPTRDRSLPTAPIR
jgi:hypothetical protein